MVDGQKILRRQLIFSGCTGAKPSTVKRIETSRTIPETSRHEIVKV